MGATEQLEISSNGFLESRISINMIPNSSALVRSEIITKNNIRYTVQPIGDYSFWVDCSLCGAKFHNMEEVMLLYRVHSNNITSRTMDKQIEKRNSIMYGIQKKAISSQGFNLEDSEYMCINENFREIPIQIDDEKKLEQLYKVLRKICIQADELGLDNVKEIKDYCRIAFADKVNQARFLWNY